VNKEPVNVKSNSDILFRFVSEEGGVSREATINVAHNGRADFVSEFRSELDTVYTYTRNDVNDFLRFLNYAAKITTPINVVDTFAPAIGDVGDQPTATANFHVLTLARDSQVTTELLVENVQVHCSNRGGGARAQTNVTFMLYKNGAEFLTVYSAGAVDDKKTGDTTLNYPNAGATKTFSALAGDVISMAIIIRGTEQNRLGSGTMDGSASFKNINWKFKVSEQL
jgi:hypothetical protein